MTDPKKNSSGLDRRQFLRSIFGLGAMAEEAQNEGEAKPASARGKFFWADVRSGQIGFPSGHTVPVGMPGSIMKLITAAALVDGKIMSPEENFECRGAYKIHNEIFKCNHAHGVVNMVQALGHSCNVYFVHAARKLSAQTVIDYAQKFGLSLPVADFPSGKFPADSLTGRSSERYVLGLAEDLQPQALQLMRVAAIIACKGNLPFLHSAESPEPHAQPFEIKLSDLTWKTLREGMQLASRQGTGKNLDPENKLKISIKTGTTPHGKTFQSWIIGYFPWNSPRYAFVLRAPAGTSQDEAVPQAHSFLFSVEWPL